MKRHLSLLLLLSGCMEMYEPKLATPAIDHDKYIADLEFCRKEAGDRIMSAGNSPEGVQKGMFIAVLGPLAAVGVAATSDKDDDYNKTGFTMINECMVRKGYDVKRGIQSPI